MFFLLSRTTLGATNATMRARSMSMLLALAGVAGCTAFSPPVRNYILTRWPSSRSRPLAMMADGDGDGDGDAVLGAILESSSSPVPGAARGIGEYWPGERTAKPAPPPAPGAMATALRSVPPILVLPGFGNDRTDYLENAVGAVPTLNRRGFNTTVLAVKQSMWLLVGGRLLRAAATTITIATTVATTVSYAGIRQGRARLVVPSRQRHVRVAELFLVHINGHRGNRAVERRGRRRACAAGRTFCRSVGRKAVGHAS